MQAAGPLPQLEPDAERQLERETSGGLHGSARRLFDAVVAWRHGPGRRPVRFLATAVVCVLGVLFAGAWFIDAFVCTSANFQTAKLLDGCKAPWSLAGVVVLWTFAFVLITALVFQAPLSLLGRRYRAAAARAPFNDAGRRLAALEYHRQPFVLLRWLGWALLAPILFTLWFAGNPWGWGNGIPQTAFVLPAYDGAILAAATWAVRSLNVAVSEARRTPAARPSAPPSFQSP